ncbi:hypothetical protein SISNIDRAFT_471307 [Sistotremastrum niveocremeum HHB9708]|uniref:Uncharacterized protein n=1 Tax=Sistotremastrum niveocremeum HHB9708 TaxID=1314777 RepID=A0A164MTR6_9AGAM|nr:hypothetical protein SISNIDRAFT_471307 [Sistotremastrum niveocremeum HHB9708]
MSFNFHHFPQVLRQSLPQYERDYSEALNEWLHRNRRQVMPDLRRGYSVTRVLRLIRVYVRGRNRRLNRGRRMTLDSAERWHSYVTMCREFFCEFQRVTLVFRAHRRASAERYLRFLDPHATYIEVIDLSSGTPRRVLARARTRAEIRASAEALNNAFRALNL